ncbi:alkaline ceramidase 3 isoform X3 [Oryzias latipes]
MAPSARRLGLWGPPTSTLDWCEENYETFRNGLEFRYICSFLGLAAVGVGSWCFHMTLLYEMQLLDELPMIYSTCVFVYCLYECFKQEKTVGLIPITLLFVFSMSVSLVYLQWKEPVFHQVMYGVLVACLVMRSIFIVTWVYPWLRPLCYASLAIFMLGFLLWNIDNIFCEQLRYCCVDCMTTANGNLKTVALSACRSDPPSSSAEQRSSSFVGFGPRCTSNRRGPADVGRRRGRCQSCFGPAGAGEPEEAPPSGRR